jgi:hypothetical protein
VRPTSGDGDDPVEVVDGVEALGQRGDASLRLAGGWFSTEPHVCGLLQRIHQRSLKSLMKVAGRPNS